MSKLAAVIIRGRLRTHHSVKHTLDSLKLFTKNSCVVLENKPEIVGMLQKVKDYITWGEIDAETEKALVAKGDVARLNPPVGGFERKGTKKPYTVGGALGFRKDGITPLIKKML